MSEKLRAKHSPQVDWHSGSRYLLNDQPRVFLFPLRVGVEQDVDRQLSDPVALFFSFFFFGPLSSSQGCTCPRLGGCVVYLHRHSSSVAHVDLSTYLSLLPRPVIPLPMTFHLLTLFLSLVSVYLSKLLQAAYLVSLLYHTLHLSHAFPVSFDAKA